MFWILISSAAIAATWILAGLAALSAARTARTPQGAIGWVVFLLAAPITALPAYMIFGHHRFKGYWRKREQAEAAMVAIDDAELSHPRASEKPEMNFAPFEAIAGNKVSRGNGGQLLIDGNATFNSIFQAIETAQDYVLVQYYILRADTLGMEFQDHLLRAANRGLSVWLMTDQIGSHGLPRSYTETLVNAGINVIDPTIHRRPWDRLRINFRNHRKTVIVDGLIGFTGGLNVGNEYNGLDPDFGAWRDTHLRLGGPIVQQLQLTFAEDWHWHTQEQISDHLRWEPETSPQDKPALIASTGPGDTAGDASMMFFSAITAAQERAWLASPYFVPDQEVLAALKHAALRGVNVRLLLPERIDHHLPWLAAFAFFDDLRNAGVRIYRYQPGFMHQKCFVIDNSLAGIGTANLDNRSFRLNFETTALFFDHQTATDVADMLCRDFSNSSELTRALAEQKLSIRLLAPMARLLAPVL